MKRYEIMSIHRHQGEGDVDAERIGNQYFTKGFELGRPALFHHEATEGRVLITSPVRSVKDTGEGVELDTMHTKYMLREIFVQ